MREPPVSEVLALSAGILRTPAPNGDLTSADYNCRIEPQAVASSFLRRDAEKISHTATNMAAVADPEDTPKLMSEARRVDDDK